MKAVINPPPAPTGAFADLAAQAAGIEAITAPVGAPAGAAPPGQPADILSGPVWPDYDGDAHDLVGFIVDGLVPVYPRLESVYTPAVCDRLSGRLARVMEKYQWDLEFFGPEIALALVVTPVVATTYKIIREDLKADRAQQPRPAAAVVAAAAPASAATIVAAAPPASAGTIVVELSPPPASAVVLDPQAAARVAKDAGANLFKKA